MVPMPLMSLPMPLMSLREADSDFNCLKPFDISYLAKYSDDMFIYESEDVCGL